MRVFRCEKRFRVLVAGRRFGKTYLALAELLRAACGGERLVWYLGPTYKQAKRIAWNRLKQLTRPYWRSLPSETDLAITLAWGGVIALRGADQYDWLRGDGLDFVVLDEYASMHPACWTEVIRPALSDRAGGALFIGTPQGFNHFYERYDRAQTESDWAAFQFTTEQGGNVSSEELASAARELDERCYRQEFQASFEHLGQGRVYYGFDRTRNVAECRYRPGVPVIWSVDFNVNPMCSVVAQRVADTVYVLDELVLPDSNTPAACEEFLRRTQPWWSDADAFAVHVYGDATGDSRTSAASRTDWRIIRDFFHAKKAACDASIRVSSSNPPVKDRINCVNSRVCNSFGERRLFVDPRCWQLIRDFEQVSWKTDWNGNSLLHLDKSDPMRTHVSDALGYYIAQEFPMRGRVGEMPYSLLRGAVFR
ncbi:MAG: terminase large subunit domain-containing protein [Bryobacteraceae bacterium]